MIVIEGLGEAAEEENDTESILLKLDASVNEDSMT
jgi:hypothetical protein